ncbi:MAG: AraC family transcriptional regulator [Arenicella sp.]|nr:AraC family transcriptional regulator [Arenicella sp.]
MKITTVPIRYVRVILESAVHRGYDGDRILSNCGISKKLLLQDKARLSANDYNNFARQVMILMEDEFCGFLDKPGKIGTFAMMTRACVNCPTLGEFIQRSIKFSNIMTDCIEIALDKKADQTRNVIRPKIGMRDPNNFLSFVMLGIAHRLFSWIIGQPLLLQTATFAHEQPDYANEYNFLFKTSIKFGQPQFSLCFPASYLALPNIQTERTLDQFLQLPVLQLMSLSSSENSAVIKISKMINAYVAADFPEFESIASELCMTTATLRRRLREEGSSYRRIKDDLRRDTAIFNLGRASMSIEQVAESVGFSEPTSFFRAFKRWTGVTPRVYVKSN